MKLTQAQFIDNIPSEGVKVLAGGNISFAPSRLNANLLTRISSPVMASTLGGVRLLDPLFIRSGVPPTTVPETKSVEDTDSHSSVGVRFNHPKP